MTLSDWFEDYASHHRDPRNRRCHAVGIPLLTYSILGVFSLPGQGIALEGLLRADVATLLIVASTLWIARMNIKLALTFGLMLFGLSFLARASHPAFWAAAFVLGFYFQTLGHRYEEKNPVFFGNPIHLLIGPLWIWAKATSADS